MNQEEKMTRSRMDDFSNGRINKNKGMDMLMILEK
jgi:hypothetical protein